jgi:hypothetical protein
LTVRAMAFASKEMCLVLPGIEAAKHLGRSASTK